MGADAVVRLLGRLLADYRWIFEDDGRRESLVRCLDLFCRGWLAVRSAADVRSSGKIPLNFEDEVNRFRVGLKRLVEDVTSKLTPANVGPFGGGSDGQRVLERTTRAWFHDKLLELLGWDLGIGGDVVQEARVKYGSRYFIDYVGVTTQQPPAPILVWEAKSWGEPWVSARNSEHPSTTAADLILAGLKHLWDGGRKETSPLRGPWHDYLAQVSEYEVAIHTSTGHEALRLVLSSGDWMVVFTKPVATFVERSGVDTSDIEVFRKAEYVQRGRRIFELLSRRSLVDHIPFCLRVGQLGSYLAKDGDFRVFHAVHVTYEVSGSELFARRPRILGLRGHCISAKRRDYGSGS